MTLGESRAIIVSSPELQTGAGFALRTHQAEIDNDDAKRTTIATVAATDAVLYWPDSKPHVTSQHVIPELPPDMIVSLREPQIVTNGDDILRAIRET